jgi:hypothetical protein
VRGGAAGRRRGTRRSGGEVDAPRGRGEGAVAINEEKDVSFSPF